MSKRTGMIMSFRSEDVLKNLEDRMEKLKLMINNQINNMKVMVKIENYENHMKILMN
jgi:hypothetical protein